MHIYKLKDEGFNHHADGLIAHKGEAEILTAFSFHREPTTTISHRLWTLLQRG